MYIGRVLVEMLEETSFQATQKKEACEILMTYSEMSWGSRNKTFKSHNLLPKSKLLAKCEKSLELGSGDIRLISRLTLSSAETLLFM